MSTIPIPLHKLVLSFLTARTISTTYLTFNVLRFYKDYFGIDIDRRISTNSRTLLGRRTDRVFVYIFARHSNTLFRVFAGEIAENAAFQRLDGLYQRPAQRARTKQLLSQQRRTGKRKRIRKNENGLFYEHARLLLENRSNE